MRRMNRVVQTGAGARCVRAGAVLRASLPARNKSAAENPAARVLVLLAQLSSTSMRVQNSEQGERTRRTDQTVHIGSREVRGVGDFPPGHFCHWQAVLAHIRNPDRPSETASENSPGAEGHHYEQC
jgi:hypothetical protein